MKPTTTIFNIYSFAALLLMLLMMMMFLQYMPCLSKPRGTRMIKDLKGKQAFCKCTDHLIRNVLRKLKEKWVMYRNIHDMLGNKHCSLKGQRARDVGFKQFRCIYFFCRCAAELRELAMISVSQ